MNDFFWGVFIFFGSLGFLYIAARVIFTAYFRSKEEYVENCVKKAKELRENNG